MKKYTKVSAKDVILTLVLIAIYVTAIVVGAIYLLPDNWVVWALIVVVGLVLIVFWHKSVAAYRCPNCGHEFEISFWVDLLAPHGPTKDGGWTLLRCPNCKKWEKATIIKIDKE